MYGGFFSRSRLIFRSLLIFLLLGDNISFAIPTDYLIRAIDDCYTIKDQFIIEMAELLEEAHQKYVAAYYGSADLHQKSIAFNKRMREHKVIKDYAQGVCDQHNTRLCFSHNKKILSRWLEGADAFYTLRGHEVPSPESDYFVRMCERDSEFLYSLSCTLLSTIDDSLMRAVLNKIYKKEIKERYSFEEFQKANQVKNAFLVQEMMKNRHQKFIDKQREKKELIITKYNKLRREMGLSDYEFVSVPLDPFYH